MLTGTVLSVRYVNSMFQAQSGGSVTPNECYLVVCVTCHPFSFTCHSHGVRLLVSQRDLIGNIHSLPKSSWNRRQSVRCLVQDRKFSITHAPYRNLKNIASSFGYVVAFFIFKIVWENT